MQILAPMAAVLEMWVALVEVAPCAAPTKATPTFEARLTYIDGHTTMPCLHLTFLLKH
jgi:hypothetical protein